MSSEHLQEEIRFLVDIFTQNGHEQHQLEQIARSYSPPATNKNATAVIRQPTVTVPWLPKIGPRLRKTFKQYGVKTIFSSPPNLKTILCAKNKCELPENSNPGVYKLDCSCGGSYIGETKKRISTRVNEHQRDVFNGNWAATGLSEHSRDCHGQFNWSNDIAIAVESQYRRRKIREVLEIRRQAPTLNRDQGTIVTTESWNGFFYKLNRSLKK